MRSIPACAGEPCAESHGATRSGVYPRVCGGTPSSRPRPTRATGLSPRVRGNQPVARRHRMTGRSIPACAGEPTCSSRAGHADRVYPRVCGGTRSPRLPWRRSRGLSPRVRGNLPHRVRGHVARGSIPACAGEPSSVSLRVGLCAVYPRVCGGTTQPGTSTQPGTGLSPRVRGNRSKA